MNQIIFQYLHSFAGQSICWDSVIIFSAKYLPYIIVVSLALFIIFGRYKKRELKMILFAIASAVLARLVITEIIRYFYHSPRPFMIYDFTPLIYDYAGSFPSGHAAFFSLSQPLYFSFIKNGALFISL